MKCWKNDPDARPTLTDSRGPGGSWGLVSLIDNKSRGLSESKTLSSSMCFGKLAILKEANLKPRIECKKAADSRDKFEFSSTTEISSAPVVSSAAEV